MGVDDEVLELVARAYEAGAEPERWPAFLSLLGDRLGDRTSAFQVHDLAHGTGSMAFTHRVDPAAEREYAGRYAAINPWILLGGSHMQTGRVLVGEQALSTRELERTEFYADFLRPHGIMHSLAAVITRDADLAAFITVQRSSAMGAWTPEEIHLVERVMPHLRRALALQQRLGAHRRKADALVETADRLTWAILLLDGAERVVFANAAARALDRATFIRVLARAQTGGGAVPRADRAPLAVSIVPLRVDRDDANAFLGIDTATHVIFAIDPEHLPRPPAVVLRDMYGLTVTEARLALALADGLSLHDVADVTGTSVATQRTHLKRVLAKTGMRRQSELVRLVLAISPPTT